MNHMCGLSEKVKVVKNFNKHSKASDKNCYSVSSVTAPSKCLNHSSKTDRQHKLKRLKTRKERSQVRDGGKDISRTKIYHHQCCRRSSRDMTHVHKCCHSSCCFPSKSETPFLSAVPVAQEPSIITDSRLIGHHGLFNHEVKSVDIERLLGEQKELEQSGQQAKNKNNSNSHLSAASLIPASLSSNGLFDEDDVPPFKNKTDPATNAHDYGQEKERKEMSCHGSNITPGQSPEQQLDLSSGSFKNMFSSKHSSLGVVTTRTANNVVSEESRESQVTVDRNDAKTLKEKVKRHTTLEQTQKNQEPRVHLKQTGDLNPLQLSSSPTSDSVDLQHRRQEPEYISKSISTVAALLCESLQFPRLRSRNLVSEGREVLLKKLRERHGPWLQENLLEVQRGLDFDRDPTQAAQDQETCVTDDSEPVSADTSVKMTQSRHFKWKAIPQPHQRPEQVKTTEWLISPMGTSVNLLDDVLKTRFSPELCMHFKPTGASADTFFVSTPAICQEENPSLSEPWEEIFKSESNKSAACDSYEDNFINHTSTVREKSCGSQYLNSNLQPFFPYQAQLSAESLHLTDRYSFAPHFPAQTHHPHQSNHFEHFSQFSWPSNCPPPPHRSQPSDTMHYPPSDMLERGPAPPISSLPSPQHWSFPPMRLY